MSLKGGECTMRTGRVRRIGWLLISLLAGQPVLALPTAERALTGEIRTLQAFADDLAADFSRDAVLDRLDYDADEIVDFVTEQIVFQAYHGVLKSSAGTLAARAGNAHDQAITLASLLKDAGYEAQILVGELTAAQAQQLNASMQMPESAQAVDLPPGLLSRALENTREYQVGVEKFLDDVRSVAQRITSEIDDRLKPAADLLESVHAASRSYRWVRYREGAADKWQEVHPALTAAADWQLAYSAVEADQVDAAALQQMSIQLWIENSAGDRHLISDVVQAPVANLMQSELTLEISSDAVLNEALWEEPAEFFEQSHYFYLSINGSVSERNKVFDLRGNVFDGSAMEGLNSLFATLNKNSQKALDSLRGISAGGATGDARQELTRVWFEFHMPGIAGSSDVVERTLFAGRGMDVEDQAALKLLQRWTVDITGSSLRQSAYQHAQVERATTALEQFIQAQKFAAANPDASAPELVQRFSRVESHGSQQRLKYLRGLFDRLPVKDNVVSYMPTANILAVREGFSRDADQIKIYEMADIVANPRWSFSIADNTLKPTPEVSVTRGVWETFAEQQQPAVGDNVINLDTAYARLSGASNLTAEASEQGIALHAPGDSANAWWWVDPSTGATVGMMETDAGIGGASVTERLVMYITWGISLAFGAVGTSNCYAAGGNFGCCAASNAIITMTGFLISTALGAAATAVAATRVIQAGTTTVAASSPYGAGAVASLAADIIGTRVNVNCGSQSGS
ncbi:MAG: hypothetical protein RJQ07_01325 [Pseudomonadales bacterium]